MLVKVCGLKRAEDVREAAEQGVDFCGFIFHPQSPRAIAPARAAELDSGGCRRVGVFVDQGSEEILGIMETARLDFVQLHGRQSVDCALRIGAEKVIRVLWPERFASAGALQAEIDRHARACAYYLLDAGKRGGGSGRHLDWEALRELRFPHPWLLAGGLLYTAGGVIYALKRPAFEQRHPNFGMHEIFHLFVMAGSFCHYLVMYVYMV